MKVSHILELLEGSVEDLTDLMLDADRLILVGEVLAYVDLVLLCLVLIGKFGDCGCHLFKC